MAASGAGAIYAQSLTGSINGTVTDQAGAALANASVTLTAGATDGPDRGSGFQRGAGFAVNMLRSQSSNFALDGGENNDTFKH